MTRIGSLFSGYGGLDLAVQAVIGGELAWYSEIEPAACRVLEAHHPGVPNLGDITRVNWSLVEPVDVLTGGYPCQPFSIAGKRKGKHDERHLWPHIVDALREGVLRRGGVALFENVDGHRTLGLADVLADLAALGMSARWGVVRASDAGAPHSRKRIFILIESADASSRPFPRFGATGNGFRFVAERGYIANANTNRDGHGGELHASRMGCLEGEATGSPRKRQRARREPDASSNLSWGKYEPAIRRWEQLNRPAPMPTIPGPNGRPRLSPVFVEWMMGLPEGHVTGHGLSATQELKMLGNGVCPQQAALALRLLGAA